MKLSGVYFYGNKASDYAIEHGFLDYRTFAKAFDAVLNNGIMGQLEAQGYYFESENYFPDNSDEIEELKEELNELEAGKRYTSDESGNTYISFIDEDGNEITGDEAEKIDERISELEDRIDELENEDAPEIFQYYIVSDQGAELLKEAGEIVFYNEHFDLNIWGVTHYGTAWDYVLTDIQINCGGEI